MDGILPLIIIATLGLAAFIYFSQRHQISKTMKKEPEPTKTVETKTIGDLKDEAWRKEMEEKEKKSVYVRLGVFQGIKFGFGFALGVLVLWAIVATIVVVTAGPFFKALFGSMMNPAAFF
jgi:uncharacterized membrane protein YukC